MSKIYLLGEKDMIFPFEAVGIELKPVSTTEEFRKAWSEMKAEREPFLAFLTPNAYAIGSKEVAAARAEEKHTVIVLPFAVGDSEQGLEEMRSQLARAMGADLIGKKSADLHKK